MYNKKYTQETLWLFFVRFLQCSFSYNIALDIEGTCVNTYNCEVYTKNTQDF